ncbi:hypothetical protein EGR_09735 [Echinococcus granulosus]|uniref:Uncharacterized protein n=1 Tax=Echinococcus granulosus TaxID=6210 RepID=W6UPU6_ECHGR|nr:hypothetical protein EGR_09735 [Echinococcus granulosus]EUB55424.1 hypothetical protein EGR_09735 [Echinococcus granulosus]
MLKHLSALVEFLMGKIHPRNLRIWRTNVHLVLDFRNNVRLFKEFAFVIYTGVFLQFLPKGNEPNYSQIKYEAKAYTMQSDSTFFRQLKIPMEVKKPCKTTSSEYCGPKLYPSSKAFFNAKYAKLLDDIKIGRRVQFHNCILRRKCITLLVHLTSGFSNRSLRGSNTVTSPSNLPSGFMLTNLNPLVTLLTQFMLLLLQNKCFNFTFCEYLIVPPL